MRTAASPRPLLASVTVPATTPVWAAAVLAASARPIADPANLAKKRVPPGERDVRIFPPEWNGHRPFFRHRGERVKMGTSVSALGDDSPATERRACGTVGHRDWYTVAVHEA